MYLVKILLTSITLICLSINCLAVNSAVPINEALLKSGVNNVTEYSKQEKKHAKLKRGAFKKRIQSFIQNNKQGNKKQKGLEKKSVILVPIIFVIIIVVIVGFFMWQAISRSQ